MKFLIYVCFVVFVTHNVTGQTIDPLCSNVVDFGQCASSGSCDKEVSVCTCFNGQPYCRCNNRKGEFYIDESCSQRWSILTFSLVASLPGLALAILVGVIVYVIMLSSSKSHKRNTVNTASPKEQALFPGMTFASDLNGRPAPNTRPMPQNHIPMITIPNSANGMSGGTRDQTMGGPSRPYSSSNSMHPYPDGGKPLESYSGTRDPPVEGPARPYSSSAGYGQTMNNPYARDSPSRNPYDNRGASLEHRNDYRQHAPSHHYEDVNSAYSPAQFYASDRGNTQGGFPRPHVNLQY
ncbi:uncharacterized protein zgc:158432 [Triplophysa dalaica]|uniref:uncharacterized protein zgc:158432 n=1 Tax=Triplophysa dalaica TaxID=1582913 RepID=UPI0024DF8A72|nr:uncharacterized protein zgc:158432 [Triplophysa dalaica]